MVPNKLIFGSIVHDQNQELINCETGCLIILTVQEEEQKQDGVP
uniref:Uncharacterized protein n=1 Tax=Romanomermis culicivorax TaxID=13658 RepID=A0A915KV54_ROMCU